jgi:CheY-like chemotaxis protein
MKDEVPARSREMPGTKILVVEDSPSARRLLQELLLRLGVALSELRLAATVPEALQVVAQWHPDIVFLDLQLRPPGDVGALPSGAADPLVAYPKTGGELALQLLKRNPSLKIVVCSASDPIHSEVGDLVRKGKVESIVKPILAGRVKEILDKLGVATSSGSVPR